MLRSNVDETGFCPVNGKPCAICPGLCNVSGEPKWTVEDKERHAIFPGGVVDTRGQ